MIKTVSNEAFTQNFTKYVNSAVENKRFFTGVDMPLDPKPYDVWQFKDPKTGNLLGVRVYMPFQEILNGLCDFDKSLVADMPNTYLWYTAALKPDSKFYLDAIPNFDKNFVPDRRHVLKLLNLISKPVIEGAGRGYYGFGEAGIGKTSTALWLFAVTNTAVIHMNCKADMVSEEFFVFQTSRDGKWVQAHGSVLQAIENNWPIVIDELDLAPDSFWPSINNLVEGRSFAVPGLEHLHVQAGTNFRLIGFGNTGPGSNIGKYNGRSSIDSSFFDRMVKDYYETLTKEQFYNIISKRFKNSINDEILKNISTFAENINNSALNDSFSEMLSPRSLIAICQDLIDYKDCCLNPLMTAIGNALGSVLNDEESEELLLNIYASTICDNVMDINDLTFAWKNRDRSPLYLENLDKTNSDEEKASDEAA